MSPVISAQEPIDRLLSIPFFSWALQHDRARSDKERLLADIAIGTWPAPTIVTILYHSTSEISWLIILYSLNFNLIKKKALSPCSLSHFNRAELAAITNCAIEMSLIRLHPQVGAHCNRVDEVISCHIETDLGWSLVWMTTFFEFGWFLMLLSAVCLPSPAVPHYERSRAKTI